MFCALDVYKRQVLGMMTASNRHSMKSQVGKSLHKLGVAMDEAVDSIVSELH